MDMTEDIALLKKNIDLLEKDHKFEVYEESTKILKRCEEDLKNMENSIGKKIKIKKFNFGKSLKRIAGLEQ